MRRCAYRSFVGCRTRPLGPGSGLGPAIRGGQRPRRQRGDCSQPARQAPSRPRGTPLRALTSLARWGWSRRRQGWRSRPAHPVPPSARRAWKRSTRPRVSPRSRRRRASGGEGRSLRPTGATRADRVPWRAGRGTACSSGGGRRHGAGGPRDRRRVRPGPPPPATRPPGAAPGGDTACSPTRRARSSRGTPTPRGPARSEALMTAPGPREGPVWGCHQAAAAFQSGHAAVGQDPHLGASRGARPPSEGHPARHGT